MNIGLITVYNSYNFGSFLQAENLSYELGKYGEVFLVDGKVRKLIIPCLRRIKRNILTGRKVTDIFHGIFFEMGEFLRMKKCWRSLKSLPLKYADSQMDLFFLGSDEIWNVSRAECRCSLFWGEGLEKPRISYAPSVNNAVDNDFKSECYKTYLSNMKAVSVRDNHSKSVIEKKTDKNVSVVLDPTLLNNPIVKKEYSIGQPYIALYLFYGKLTAEEKKSIIKFARKKNMPLVSGGQYINWCDYNVHSYCGDPFYIYKNADYVITNTFHGTAYAINYNKRFVTFGRGNSKIVDLLFQFQLEDCMSKGPEYLTQQLEKNIDYNKVNDLLQKNRIQSRQFIRNAILSEE
ncbi:MAG: polysaccharide pyruvyl transferase family protein [Lachnospiraceae bacterium]|nr:polysaccharide pyruvyl transferase family protein [Lachnospiraceae bacterium]